MSLLNPKKVQENEALCINLLKENKLSVTGPRRLILTLLMQEHGPFTAEEIHKKLPPNSCDQATIYRCLNQFLEVGLVNTSFLEKDTAHFEYNRPGHHHHHIICKICKKIDSFHECFMDKIEQKIKNLGYQDVQHRLEIFAICGQCAKERV